MELELRPGPEISLKSGSRWPRDVPYPRVGRFVRHLLRSAIYGCGYNSCGCNARLSEVRSGSFVVDLGPVWCPKGSKPVPNRPQIHPKRPRLDLGQLQIAVTHIHRSSMRLVWALPRPPNVLSWLLQRFCSCNRLEVCCRLGLATWRWINVALLGNSSSKMATVGRCADGALGDTPGECKIEHRKIL